MYFIDGQVFFRVQLFKSWIASVIHPINYYPDWINILAKPICPIHWIAIYQVDSIIHLSNNWAQDNYLLFISNSTIFFGINWVCMYNYAKIKGLDSREITSLPKNENVVDMTRVISTIAEKNCMLITRLIGRDDIVMMSLPSCWLAEIWCMIAQLTGSHGELEVEFKFQRCSCEALLPFPTRPLEHPAKLALRLTG